MSEDVGGKRKPSMRTAFMEGAVEVGKDTRQGKLDGFKEEHDAVIKSFDKETRVKREAEIAAKDTTKKISRITQKKEEKRRQAREAIIDKNRSKLVGKVAAEKAKKIKAYLESHEAEEWKVKAIAVDKALVEQKTFGLWITAVHGSGRSVGPFEMPRKLADCTTFYGSTMLDEVYTTPYGGCYAFLMLLLRIKTMKGTSSEDQSFALMKNVLHSDCFLKGDPPKVRKHTKLAIINANAYAVKSLFVGATPINEYDLDLADLVVNFEPCPRYENKDGAHCNVGVYFGGSEPNKPRLKTVEMAFEEGRWKARVFNGVFTAVVKPFYGGTADEAELAREDAYRAHFKLQSRESIALEMRAAKQKALASKDHYEGPEADDGRDGMTKAVDLSQVKRRMAREKEEAKMAAMSTEERDAYEAVKQEKKLEKQRAAKVEMKALAESNAKKEASAKKK